MVIRVLLLLAVISIGSVLAQDDNRLINVKQIMRDAFDIMRSAPPLPGFDVSKVLPLPLTSTQAPVYNYAANNHLTPDEYQALITANSNRPLSQQQRITLYNLQQKINIQKQYSQTHGNAYNPYNRAPQSPPLVSNPINRLFGTPTEKDMERLLRLPADILYKIAEEGKYIDPEDESQGYSHSKSVSDLDRPLPAGVSSSDSSPGLFGDGFSFNVQEGANGAGPIGNPFLTKEDVKPSPEIKPEEPKLEHKETEEKPESTTQISATSAPTKEITYQNLGGTKVDKSKPYFVVNNGEWQLIVPQMDNKPALQIPVKEFTKLNEAVARASARSGMPIDMSKMMAAEEIHVKSSEVTSAPIVEAEVTTTTSTEAPKKKIQKTPASAFVQEAESIKSEEEEKATPITPTTTQTPKALSQEEVIILNGKRYKLVNEEKPTKKKVSKKTKKTQAKGKTGAAASTPSTTAAAPVTVAPVTQPLPPQLPAQTQLPSVNQATLLSQQYPPQQQLTIEQQQILAELQNRYVQNQANLMRQQRLQQQQQQTIAPQNQNPNPNVFVLNGGENNYNYNNPQMAAANLANQLSQQQPFYQKVKAPEIMPQMQAAAINNNPVKMVLPQQQQQQLIPIKVQPTLAVMEQPKPVALGAATQIVKNPIDHIDSNQPKLPLQKQYSLQELDQFYNSQHPEINTKIPEIKEKQKSADKVYAPHKQIKIRLNNSTYNPVDGSAETSPPIAATKTKTTVVDATSSDAVMEEKKRIADLRRRFALERQQLTRRNKVRFEKTTNLEPTTPQTFMVTEQHCYNIKNFARQAGSNNVYEYAVSHCHYIENYYPDLKCANVGDYIKLFHDFLQEIFIIENGLLSPYPSECLYYCPKGRPINAMEVRNNIFQAKFSQTFFPKPNVNYYIFCQKLLASGDDINHVYYGTKEKCVVGIESAVFRG